MEVFINININRTGLVHCSYRFLLDPLFFQEEIAYFLSRRKAGTINSDNYGKICFSIKLYFHTSIVRALAVSPLANK